MKRSHIFLLIHYEFYFCNMFLIYSCYVPIYISCFWEKFCWNNLFSFSDWLGSYIRSYTLLLLCFVLRILLELSLWAFFAANIKAQYLIYSEIKIFFFWLISTNSKKMFCLFFPTRCHSTQSANASSLPHHGGREHC